MSIHVPSCTKDVPAQPVDWEMMVDVAPWIQPGLIELAGSLGFDRACRALRSFAISLLDVLLSSDYLRSACLSLSLSSLPKSQWQQKESSWGWISRPRCIPPRKGQQTS